jgi:hypothetical protein
MRDNGGFSSNDLSKIGSDAWRLWQDRPSLWGTTRAAAKLRPFSYIGWQQSETASSAWAM